MNPIDIPGHIKLIVDSYYNQLISIPASSVHVNTSIAHNNNTIMVHKCQYGV